MIQRFSFLFFGYLSSSVICKPARPTPPFHNQYSRVKSADRVINSVLSAAGQTAEARSQFTSYANVSNFHIIEAGENPEWPEATWWPLTLAGDHGRPQAGHGEIQICAVIQYYDNDAPPSKMPPSRPPMTPLKILTRMPMTPVEMIKVEIEVTLLGARGINQGGPWRLQHRDDDAGGHEVFGAPVLRMKLRALPTAYSFAPVAITKSKHGNLVKEKVEPSEKSWSNPNYFKTFTLEAAVPRDPELSQVRCCN